jgi:hypothetical protein
MKVMEALEAKAFVMASIAVLVAGGSAHCTPLENGDIELRLDSGETFLLGVESVRRLR